MLNRYHSTDTDTDISKMAKNGRLSADTDPDIYLIKYHSADTDTDISKMADIGRYRYRYRFNTTKLTHSKLHTAEFGQNLAKRAKFFVFDLMVLSSYHLLGNHIKFHLIP